MLKRIIAMLLAIVMLMGNVPIQAFATEEQQEAVSCTTEGCEFAAGHEGSCSNYMPREEQTTNLDTPASCVSEGCAYAAGHEGYCSNYVEPAADVAIYVTVSNRGELGMAYEEVTVSDLNQDGKLSVDEALYAAHIVYGKGYASEIGTVTKLWGVYTTNVSFFVNHEPVSSDVSAAFIRKGDYLVASVDQDAVNDYDKYSRFHVLEKSASSGKEFILTLVDDAGNALAGMELGLSNGNGTTTMLGQYTDENGQVTLSFDQEGLYCVTARGTVQEVSVDINTLEMTAIETPIIAPVCMVTVSGTVEQEAVAWISLASTDTETGEETNTETGEETTTETDTSEASYTFATGLSANSDRFSNITQVTLTGADVRKATVSSNGQTWNVILSSCSEALGITLKLENTRYLNKAYVKFNGEYTSASSGSFSTTVTPDFTESDTVSYTFVSNYDKSTNSNRNKNFTLNLTLLSSDYTNQAPQLTGDASVAVSIRTDETYTLDLTTVFTDPDDDTANVQYFVAIDGGAAEATASGFSYAPQGVETKSFVFTAQDPSGAVSEAYTVNLTVRENTAPTLTGDAEAELEGMHGLASTIDLSKAFTDADGDALTYTVAIDGAQALAASAGYSFTPSAAATYTLVFQATDGKGAASPVYTVTLTAAENPAPTLTGDERQSVTLDQYSKWTLDLSGVFADNEGDSLSYTVSINGADAMSTGASYSYTADTADAQTFVFRATDKAGNVFPEYTVSLTVNPLARTAISTSCVSSGIWDTWLSGITVTGPEIAAYVWNVEAGHSENTEHVLHIRLAEGTADDAQIQLSYSASYTVSRVQGTVSGPSAVTLSGGKATATVNTTATRGTARTYVLNFTNAVNQAPTASAESGTAEVTTGDTYSLDLAAIFTDPDGDTLSYTVTCDGETTATESSFSRSISSSGTHTFVFTATDTWGAQASYTVTVTAAQAAEAYAVTVNVPQNITPAFYITTSRDSTGDVCGEALTAQAGEAADSLVPYTVSVPSNVSQISIRGTDADGADWGGMAADVNGASALSVRQVTMNVTDYNGAAAASENTITYSGNLATAGNAGWLLVTGQEYTYTAVPGDTSMTTTSVAETLPAGSEVYTVSLSLEISDPLTITVTTGATAQLYRFSNYYSYTEFEAKKVKDNEDGTSTYYFIASSKDTGMIYRVSMPGKITKAGWLSWGSQNLKIIHSDDDKSIGYRLEDYSGTGLANSGITEDSVLLNINSRNHLSMSAGETKTLKAYRAWEIIPVSYNNWILTPDFTYTVLSGSDVVSLSDKESATTADGDWKTLTANQEGIAVIEVTYGAMEVSGGSYDGIYGASDPARTGLVVVQVGGSCDTSVDFGIDCFASRGIAGSSNVTFNPAAKRSWDAEFDTLYFTGSSGQLKLTPTANTAITEVAVSNDKGASWTVLTGEEGTYTATIVPGNNILRVTTAAGVSYQVVRGDQLAVELSEQTGDGDGLYEAGETVRVTLKGLHMPIPKMAGNYNPGYAGNTAGYSSTHLNYTFAGNTVYGPGTQYNFITTANYLDVTIPEDTTESTLSLTDGYIGVGVIGLTEFDQGGDSHRNIPDSGCATRDSKSTWHTRSILPEIKINIARSAAAVESITLDRTEATLRVGETVMLTATVLPETAENKNISWTSDNLAVAMVDGNGMVTGRSEGSATITATTEDGAKTATCAVTVEAVPAKTAEVYFSVSHDDQFIKTDYGVAALQKLTVPYFDLSLYGMEAFSLSSDHDDYGKPTMLHLYIYATEVLKCGIDPDKAGAGYLKDQIGSDLFAYTGSAGSICIDKFWGMDMNLNYYHNYVYPADETGYGITADRVVLEDGDIVTVGHFTSWSFFGDSTSIFNYLMAGKDTVVTTAAQNEMLTLQVYRAGANLGNGGTNTPVAAVRDVYYTAADGITSGDVTAWTKLGTTDESGSLNADISELPVGQYLLAVAGQKGVEYPDDIVSTPGGILLNVTANTLAPAVRDVIAKIKTIGEVTLEKAAAITAAREAYDALTAGEKSAVTNYAVLEAAEQKLGDLKAAAAVDTLIDAIGEVTLDSEAAIQAARSAYDALTEDRKLLVESLKTLTTAETVLAALQAAQEDKKAAQKVANLIEAIGEIALDSEEAIQAARTAYDALSDAQKAYVTNYDELQAAEETLRLLKLSNTDIANIYQTTGDFLAGREAPGVGSIDGEWRVIGLARAGRSVPDAYYEAAEAYVKANIAANGRLHENKSSDNSRIILALTAIGKDVTDVGGYDLLSGMNEMAYIQKQGLNGTIWALLAFDSYDYPIPEGDVTREALIQEILSRQLSDGGWALAGTVSDPDMTGMALTALAPYYDSNNDAKTAVDAALICLSGMQNADGTFSGSEGVTSESLAQVVTALTSLGIDPETDSRFVKYGVSALDALASFYVEGGGFRHGTTGERNMMATEQGYYALVSYYRLLQNQNDLYDMSDVTIETDAANQAAADAVIAQIDAIGTVDLSRENAIQEARTAYNDLTDAQKKLVTNYSTLTDAESALAQLKQTAVDTEAAECVKKLIDDIGTVDLSRENAIATARSTYNALTALQKDLVGPAYLKKLTDAEDKLRTLKKEQADEEAANAVEQKISAIGSNITLGSETKITTARNAYNALTADQKALVSNYQTLLNAEAALDVRKSTVSVTFSLLGCYKHGTGETSVHTLAGGNLQTWIAAKTYQVQPGATVKDIFEKALTAAGLSWSNPTGNYVESITYNGQKIGEFTNGQKSGWMYTRNGEHPNLGVAQQTLVNGDVIIFHYTDDYTKEEGSTTSGGTTSGTTASGSTTNYITTTTQQTNASLAENVDQLIDDIGTEITRESADKIKAARAAYDKLTEEQKKLVTMYDLLVAAETKLTELKGVSAENVYAETGDYLQDLGTPGVGAVGGEWMVIGLARSGRAVPDGYYDHVLDYVRDNINEANQLHSAKSSDNSRVILALTAIGKDVTDVDGHDLLEGLNSMDYIRKQGINGPIWALIAFDSGNYPVPEGDVSREKLIDVILEAQLSDGGWAMSGTTSDPDLTGMAIQALAPYMESRLDVKNAVETAVWTLSRSQNDNGSFSSVDGPSSESIAQVIVALSALGIDADTDARFVKNGISALDALLTYFVPGGGFRHVLTGNLDGMATEQAYYTLVAYNRMKQNQNFLYDMTDVIDRGGDVVVEETTEPTEMPTEPVVEEDEDNGNAVVIWTGVMTLCSGAVVVLLLNRKKLFGKFL